MSAIQNALVIGGGFSGMAAAIRMLRAGIAVDIVETDAAWCPLGAGITVNGPTLRALQELGLYASFQAHGFTSVGVDIYMQQGNHIGQLATPSPVGTTLPGGGGIMRPVLAKLMADAVRAVGARVILGHSWKEITQDANKVHVTMTSGEHCSYDLVVGADGVNSQLRAKFMPEVVPPQYVGQGVWRAVAPRPATLERPAMWLGHHIKCGVNPVSATQMYLFITEDRLNKEHIDPATWPEIMQGLLKPFTAPILQGLIPLMTTPEAAIDYRPLSNLIVPAPWNCGRLLLIGDAVAATTPHLASGAGIGIESGIVLGEELERHADLQQALDAFHARRFERCRMVVKNSERLCLIEVNGGDKAEHGQIMRESLMALAQPI